MRVVLDSNIILSAFLWQQQLKPIYLAVKAAAITPCFNQQTWSELQRTLGYRKLKHQLVRAGVDPDAMLQLIASRSYFTMTKRRINIIPNDPSDNYILACALAARALFIISGDQHLLRLKEFHGIPILRPKDFIQRLRLV